MLNMMLKQGDGARLMPGARAVVEVARLALDSRHINIESGLPNRLGREFPPFAPAHRAEDLFFL